VPDNNSKTCKHEETLKNENNPLNNIKNVIGVMSGKSGVGKSTISVLLAKELNKKGYKVGILEADITESSILKLLDLGDVRAKTLENVIWPVKTKNGIKVMSLNLLIDENEQPVILRGSLKVAIVKQFWTNVLWEKLDYLIIDMPPGTADEVLTAMQTFPIDGIVIVSMPQDLVSIIVEKDINIMKKMKVKIIGLIENMSYIVCPYCGKEIRIFDNRDKQEFLKKMDVQLIGEFPMSKEIIDAINKSNKSNKISKALNDKFKTMTEKVIDSTNLKEKINMKI
jgi:Mrp family chromosome partitioning ATPase